MTPSEVTAVTLHDAHVATCVTCKEEAELAAKRFGALDNALWEGNDWYDKAKALEADNAALREELEEARSSIETMQAHYIHCGCDSEVGWICEGCNEANATREQLRNILAQPHPGKALLAERDELRRERDALSRDWTAAINENTALLERLASFDKAPRSYGTEGEGWSFDYRTEGEPNGVFISPEGYVRDIPQVLALLERLAKLEALRTHMERIAEMPVSTDGPGPLWSAGVSAAASWYRDNIRDALKEASDESAQ